LSFLYCTLQKAENITDFSIHKKQHAITNHTNSGDLESNEKNDNDDVTPPPSPELDTDKTIEDIATNTYVPVGSSSSERLLKNFASSIRSSLNAQLPWERRPSNSQQVDSKKQCPICLDDYGIGDEICSSPNHECPHVFHLECMSEWLMKRNECPLCRADYLKVSTDDEEQGRIDRVETVNGTSIHLASANATAAVSSSSSPLGIQTLRAVAVEL
jgi:hypothetical protein